VNWTVIILMAVLPAVVLIAWSMWLLFAALVVKWHGPEGLKAIKPVAAGFQPREWALLLPRQVLSTALSALIKLRPDGTQRPPTPAVESVQPAPAASPIPGAGPPPDVTS